MSDVIPRRSPCNGVLPHAPPLSLGACREGSRCSNSSLSHPASDPLPLKRVRTDSHPLTGSSPRNAGVKASEACVSPASDACAPSGVSQPRKCSPHDRHRTAFAFTGGTLADACTAAGHEEAASLPRLLSMFGEAVADNSTSEVGVFGQAILVSSRLGAYCGAAWRLLQDEGARHTDPDKASPLSHFCDILKLLIRQRIIQCVQELYATALTSEDAARSLLHHVLLWQYLKHRNVMDLVSLSLSQEAAPRASSDECFLATLGVPIVQWALRQAKGSMRMTQRGAANGSAHVASGGEEVDMVAVLRMVYESANMRSPSCTHAAVNALAEDPQALHRVARFLSHHHGLVTQILSGVDHTPNQLLVLYMALAHASALLQPDSAMEVQDTACISAARSELMAFNTTVETRQRAAKATILDVRITAARSASWNRDVASCTVKAAVSQSFREVYLFKELKQLLHTWTGMLDAAVESDTLPNDAILDASAAAAATFDPSPLGLRFRVPSAGFLLVWSTSPNSPAHNLPHRSAACMKSCPRFSAGQRAASLQKSTADQPEVRIEVSGPPVDAPARNHDAHGPTSPSAAVQASEGTGACLAKQPSGEVDLKAPAALHTQGSEKQMLLPTVVDVGNGAAQGGDGGPATVSFNLFAAATGLAGAGDSGNLNNSGHLSGSPDGQGAELGQSLKRALE